MKQKDEKQNSTLETIKKLIEFNLWASKRVFSFSVDYNPGCWNECLDLFPDVQSALDRSI